MEVIFRDLQKVVKKHFPNSEFDTCNVLKWMRGTNHLVYFIEVDKKKYVLRMNFKDIRDFHREIWAYQNFSKWYIPCPKLYFYDESKEIVPYPYMILECVDGEHPESKEDYILVAKEGLPVVHSVDILGFGEINDGKGEFDKWEKYISDRFEKSYPNIKSKKLLDDEVLDRIKKLYKIMEKQIGLSQGKLLLSDIGRGNAFIKNNKFYKFIDFEIIVSGDPIYDYSTLDYYEDVFIWPENIVNNQTNLRRFYFYCMIIALKRIWFYYKNGRDIEKAKKKLKEYTSKLNMLIQVDLPQF